MSIRALFKKAHMKHMQKNYDGACKLYEEILRLSPNHLDANYLLGTLYAEKNQLSDAEKYLIKAEEIDPGSPYIKVNLGNVFKTQKKYELALKYFNEAIDIDDSLSQAHYGLATVLQYFTDNADTALQHYYKALALDPKMPEIHHSLGKLLSFMGNQDAIDYFKTAIRLNPNLHDVYKDLGLAYLVLGRNREASEAFRKALQHDPGNVISRYFLCASEGQIPDAKLQEEYVQYEFDSFAENFDKVLTEKLEYNVPSLTVEFMKECLGDTIHFKNAADLGCGTGLSGYAVRKYCDALLGIDVSDKMIEIATTRNCYDKITQGEIVEVLKNYDGLFDLFLSTDVFIYIGGLEELFDVVKEKASAGALFAFSTEYFEGNSFIIQKTGRYAHSHEYIESLSAERGFSIINSKQINCRKEFGKWITGEIFILRLNHDK